jgi:hypothetical protein
MIKKFFPRPFEVDSSSVDNTEYFIEGNRGKRHAEASASTHPPVLIR